MQDIALIEAQQPEIVGGYARIDDALPVFTGSSWEDHVQAWIDAEDEVSEGQWKQAAVAASVTVHYGEQSLDEFAKQVGCTSRYLRLCRLAHRRRSSRLSQNGNQVPFSNLSFTHWAVIPESESEERVDELLEACMNESLSVKGLLRRVKELRAPSLDDDITNAIEDVRSREIWQDIKRNLGTLGGRCPNLRGIIGAFIEEMEYELTRPTETIRQAIDSAIIEGYDEIDQIAQRINRNRIYVAAWMNRLEEEGDYIRFEKARAPGARGAARTGYRPKG